MPDDEYDPDSVRILAGMEPPVRDPSDPIVRWSQEFLGLPKSGAPRPGERVALTVEDLTDAEMTMIMASRLVGPDYSLDGLPDGEARYPVEDGPGSSTRVELSVRVLVGMERSTVLVVDPVTGRALTHEVLPHGREADVAAAAVESVIRARLPGEPRE
ncbi:hypothetical protein [Methylobacterium sp. 22177]|uniref:hypothetical protein n=1 Tax=Methylobacterium sp. 22177 TaxID=3453885 RepID=UPI003F84E6F5